MEQVIVIIAAIVGISVGIIEIRKYLNDDPQNKKVLQLLVGLGIVIIIGGFVINFFYIGPKSTGNNFLDGFRDFNSSKMIENVCPESDLYTALSGFGGALMQLSSALANTVITNESFIPLVNQYSFTWTGVSIAGRDDPHSATIYIKPIGLTEFCIYNANGL